MLRRTAGGGQERTLELPTTTQAKDELFKARRALATTAIGSTRNSSGDALEKKGVSVCRVGIENPKAPIHYVFVDQAFDAKAVLAGLYESGGLAADSDGSGIHSREYAWVGFEEGICPPL